MIVIPENQDTDNPVAVLQRHANERSLDLKLSHILLVHDFAVLGVFDIYTLASPGARPWPRRDRRSDTKTGSVAAHPRLAIQTSCVVVSQIYQAGINAIDLADTLQNRLQRVQTRWYFYHIIEYFLETNRPAEHSIHVRYVTASRIAPLIEIPKVVASSQIQRSTHRFVCHRFPSEPQSHFHARSHRPGFLGGSEILDPRSVAILPHADDGTLARHRSVTQFPGTFRVRSHA